MRTAEQTVAMLGQSSDDASASASDPGDRGESDSGLENSLHGSGRSRDADSGTGTGTGTNLDAGTRTEDAYVPVPIPDASAATAARARGAPPDPATALTLLVLDLAWTVVSGSAKIAWALLGVVTDVLIGLPALFAIIATALITPVLNVAAFGYLLDLAGGAGREKRAGWAFRHVRPAKRVFTGLAGCALALGPAVFLHGLFTDAAVIDPSASRVGLLLLTALAYLLGATHAALALVRRRGRFLAFLRPFWNLFWGARLIWRGDFRSTMVTPVGRGARAAWSFCEDHFWLGLRGFAVTLLWLLPSALLIGGAWISPGLFGLGLVALIPAAVLLPLVQAHFAREDRFAAGFDVAGAARVYARAPLPFVASVAVLLLTALPLNAFKVEALPSPILVASIGVLFVGSFFFSKALAAWGMARAARREAPAPFFLSALAPCALAPIAIAYAFTTGFMPLVLWPGSRGLLDNHSFLLPIPY